MSEQITVSGLVATTPRHIVTQDGLPITSFRLASAYKRFDQVTHTWVTGETNWYTITCLNILATNVSSSVNKGERITVVGGMRVRDWDNGERAGTSVEIEATSIGHDLVWGRSTFTRATLADLQQEEAPEVAFSVQPIPAPVVEEHSCNCRGCDERNS